MKKQRGLTLLEVMMALAVGAILVAVGVPSFVATIRNSEMTSAANGLVGALYATRSEAVKRRTRVTMCRAETISGTTSCDPTGSELAVFSNTGNDATIDLGSGDVLIRVTPWLIDNITVSSSTVPAAFSFNASGFTRGLTGNTVSGDIMLCGPRGNEGARIITLAPTGRPMVRNHADVTGATSCS